MIVNAAPTWSPVDVDRPNAAQHPAFGWGIQIVVCWRGLTTLPVAWDEVA
jgi:hypothetical protein